MKVQIKITDIQTASRGLGRESKDGRKARIRSWFGALDGALIPVGRLLDQRDAQNVPFLASALAKGETLDLGDHLMVAGKRLSLAKGLTLSLGNASTWACPACNSAHGTGKGVSPAVSADMLATNQFYYRPGDKTLLTISKTCFGDYVQAEGLYTLKNFVGAPVKSVK